MGAFMVWDIIFETEKDRQKFEAKYQIKKKDILVDQYANSLGFVAWEFLRNPFLNPIYFMGFMGYGDPHYELKDCLKEGIKIKFLAWIPINDKGSEWKKIRGRW
ncbi:hypothetical protein CCP1ISM_60013 [Azospirillaceae bacterium]